MFFAKTWIRKKTKKTTRTLKYFDAGEFKGNFVHKVTTAFASNCIELVYMCLIYLKKKTKQTLHVDFEYSSERNPLIWEYALANVLLS